MKILDIVDILRKDNTHYLWNKRKKHFNLEDWLELDRLKNNLPKQEVKESYGKSQDKKVMRISTGEIYFNGKECYTKNNIKRCTFYAIMTGRRKKVICDFKYI